MIDSRILTTWQLLEYVRGYWNALSCPLATGVWEDNKKIEIQEEYKQLKMVYLDA